MSSPETRPESPERADSPSYDARYGYRNIDALRYERRRYGTVVRRINLRRVVHCILRGLAGVPAGGVVLRAPCRARIPHAPLRTRGLQRGGASHTKYKV